GTRFWPLSREAMPKQLLRLGGEKTLIQQTLHRIEPLIPAERAFVVTNKRHGEQIRFQLPQFPKSNLILEPEARNTAPAVGLAALHLWKRDPEAVLVVLAADHAVLHGEVFIRVVSCAADLAAAGHLVTLGVVPARPEMGYGYIQAGEPISPPHPGPLPLPGERESSGPNSGVFPSPPEGGEGQGEGVIDAFHVKRFVEKPDLATAKTYLEDGSYFWNSGMFVWKAAAILEEIRDYMPELHAGLMKIGEVLGTDQERTTTEEVFRKLKPVSIDYGVMEKSKKVVVIPADLGWSDVGSWTALYEIAPRDEAGNVVQGNVVGIDNSGSLLYANGGRLVAALGLKDTIVVDTEDATLVCAADRAQEVKKVVEAIKQRGGQEHLIHRTVVRPWGSYTLLEEGERYKIKRIMVNPGAKLSYQMHYHRSEHWVVVSGTAKVTRQDEVFFVNPNESTYIPMETKHRLENPGKIPLQIIEIQNGEYLGEDDIVRFDDVYGRTES
ncbi:MAG: mannose-1-phosphate guanylyltransferase/mannose-6-phosphate isomerase, partial [Nitrospirae bacterium]|nr:mannose-1-phosphate guanylyltransferase/mannose-6-phosphate isomerase [Nitrospirota bacterium]